MIKVYVGYDPREAIAFHVCISSIIRNCSEPVEICPLHLGNFRRFYAESHADGSNAFIYSRFLVPYLSGFVGHAIFLDGDMVVQGDLAELWRQRSHWHAAQVAKHEYKTKATVKYLGNKNEDYPRKNWSSVILWNCGHYGNRMLTPDYVERQAGAHLHRFKWLKDERIGELPLEWNWLATEYPDKYDAKLIHYTLGVGLFDEYKDAPMMDLWHAERKRLNCEPEGMS